MNLLPDFLRRFRLLAAGSLMALIGACGPGTGGTGTGPDISFSSAVAGVSAGVAVPAAPGCSACTRIDLRLQDGRVEMDLPCGRFTFTGAWSAEAVVLELAGSFQPGSGPAVPATLRLAFAPNAGTANEVTASLSAADAVLLATQVLQRRAEPAPAGTCTP